MLISLILLYVVITLIIISLTSNFLSPLISALWPAIVVLGIVALLFRFLIGLPLKAMFDFVQPKAKK